MNQVVIEEERQTSPAQQFRAELEKMGSQFAVALPTHIKPERFQRVVTTAVLSDPAILRADRKSLMEAAIRAAQDGLLPDKREGAFVVFNTKVKIDGKDEWINAVQWMPMIGGIIKKMHQSGEIAMITAKVVYGGDTFRAWVDDDGEHVAYEQAEHPDYDAIRQVFALAKTKDGAVYVETLTPRDIEKIRSVSRSKDRGPWVQWWEEMAKKSAIRRLAKRLPLSADLHELIQRDNDLYDLSQAPVPRAPLRERLAAASQVNRLELREGFDADFVARETAALTATKEGDQGSEAADVGEDEPEPQSEPPASSPAAGAGSDDLAPKVVAADQSEPAKAATDMPAKASAGSPKLSDEDRAWLLLVARRLLAATAPEWDTTYLKKISDSIIETSTPPSISKEAKRKAGSIEARCIAVCDATEDLDLKWIAGIAGCEVADLKVGQGRAA